jgi:hypothetical protein
LVFPDIATSPGPLTTAGKFRLFVNQSISPAYIFVAASDAALEQARNVPEGYGQGWGAYGSRFGASMARTSSSSFFGSFLFASWLHQDPRFFPQSKPSFWRSFEIFDTANRHYPKRFRGRCIQHLRPVGAAGRGGACQCVFAIVRTNRWEDAIAFAIDLAWRVGGNMFKDYWPTFFHNMGLNRLKVIPDPSEPHGQGSR